MTTEFDEVFEQLEAPEYPATCDNCGTEGTNASLEEHVCMTRDTMNNHEHDTPKRVAGIGWQTERLPIHGMRIVDNTGRLIVADVYDEEIAEQIVREHNATLALSNESPTPRAGEWERLRVERRDTRSVIIDREGNAMAFACGNNGNEREQRATQIATEHNQYSTLVEQRDRLLRSFRQVRKMFQYIVELEQIDPIHRQAEQGLIEVTEAITTITQEGKS